jgi:glycerol uptake facilitator-like aquaporin
MSSMNTEPETPPFARRIMAEALGSFFPFACVIGSRIMAENLARGNAAIALLGNTLATAAILFVLITILGSISGAHMNPAVSLVAASRRELRWNDAVAYIGAQYVFGILCGESDVRPSGAAAVCESPHRARPIY